MEQTLITQTQIFNFKDVKSVNDSHSFSTIYYNYYSLVQNIARKYESDSDIVLDLVHDIMIKLNNKLSSFNKDSKISTWIYRIATNHCLDEIRRNKKKKSESLEGFENILQYIDNDFEENEEKQSLIKTLNLSLDLLPSEDKELLIKKYVQNLSIQEISEETGLKSSAVKMRLKRSRDKIYSKLIPKSV